MPHVPRISVCLLSYNHSAILRETLTSVLAQDFGDFELIVSDDRSRDRSWQVIQEVAATDTRLRPVQPNYNIGMALNANFAVSHARAPYVALLHHDDLCRPDLLAQWFTLIDANPTVAFVSNAFAIGGTTRIDYHPFSRVTRGTDALTKILFPRWGCPVRGTAMIRRSAWDAVGGMRPQFGMLADVDLWMRLAAKWDVGYVAEPLLEVRAERPEDYPEQYVRWSWERQQLLYAIHGINRAEYFGVTTLRGRAEQARYRARVNADELKWLAYAVLRGKREIVTSSDKISNPYESAPVRWIRTKLRAHMMSQQG